jgi:hypothetical protein
MAKISGKVVDIDNVPLMGANVKLRCGSKSGKVGTTTDFDGNFNLEVNDIAQSDIFEISYIGFIKQNFTTEQLQDKKIVLQESATELDEIVITGTKPKNTKTTPEESKLKVHLTKNKYAYAGVSGLLGLALILISIKKLK